MSFLDTVQAIRDDYTKKGSELAVYIKEHIPDILSLGVRAKPPTPLFFTLLKIRGLLR